MRDTSMKILKMCVYALKRNKLTCRTMTAWPVSNLRYRTPDPKIETIYISLSPKRENIYKFLLYMLEKHNFLILSSYHVPKLRYSAHARKLKPFYTVQNQSDCVTILKHSVYC